MNKEITCRLIDGKPVVEYKEEYAPKRGDIVVSGYYTSGESHWIAVFGEKLTEEEYCAQAFIGLKVNYEDEKFGMFIVNEKCSTQCYTRKASLEESEVMHHFLNENGYELVGDTVVKKRWVPRMGEYFWCASQRHGKLSPVKDKRSELDYTLYLDCFKSEQACQSACDKLNEYALTLPQE